MIVDAVSTQDWPGEAAVDVSIVNWIDHPESTPRRFVLDGRDVEGIDTALQESTIPVADVPVIRANRGRAFQGFLPGAKYDLGPAEAEKLLARGDAEYAEVVKPYLDTRDIARTVDQRPTRYVIDFGQLTLEEAMAYPAALDVIRGTAREAREASASYSRNPRWWQFLWLRPEFRRAVAALPRFIAGTRVAKRIYFVWCAPGWRPSDATNVFALDSDYAFGVLTSRVHTEWAAKKSSTLEDRIRYTPTSAFETFPWPQTPLDEREHIAGAAREVLSRRSALCTEHGIGLGRLYDRVDDGAYTALAAAHRRLDEAVVAAFGWQPDLLDDVVARNRALYALNQQIVAGAVHYEPF